MTTVKEINHDTSTTLSHSSNYDNSVSDPDGAFTIKPAAALDGSTNGLEFDFDAGIDSGDLLANMTLSSNGLRMRMRFNLANLTYSDMSNDSIVNIFFGLWDNSGGTGFIFQVALIGKAGGTFAIKVNYLNDDANIIQVGSDEAIASSGEVCVDLRAIRETNSTSADGEIEFFINGVSKASISNAENNAAWADVDTFRVRIDSDDADFTGELYADQFLVDDDSATSLCISGSVGNYIIGTAIDNETDGNTAWLTLWRDNMMYLQRWDLPTLTKEHEISLGAATLAEVQAKSRIAYPFAGSDQEMWVFGNMVDPAFLTGTVHLAETSGGGASGTWAINPDLSSWGGTDVLDSLFVSTDQDGLGTRLFAAVRRQSGVTPELWQGINALNFISTIPFPTGTGVEYRGMHVGRNQAISVGTDTLGTGSSRILSAISPYTSWSDVTFDYPSGTVQVLRYL